MKSIINRIDFLVVLELIIITLCLGAVLASTYVYADDPISSTSSANASVTVAEACSLAVNNVSPHTTTLTNNNTAEDVGSTTFTATCNDPSGLAIYAVGYSNDEFGNTNLIGSTGNIATGTNDTNSNWSMKVVNATGYTAPDFLQSSYTSVPSTYTKVASKNSNTTSATSFGVNATYRFHISATQPADTYTGKVKYTMVHPASEVPPAPQTTQSGKICYYPNGTAVAGTMGCQNIASSVTLLASNFSRSGYGFAGWNTEFDYSGTFYGPNETISLNTADYSGTNPGLSLYAVWVKSVGSLQDSSKVTQLCGTGGTGGSLITAPIDGTANLSSVSALTDQRDNNTYAIARLADGKCWMIENMRLENTATGNSDGSLAQGYNSSFAGLADPEEPSLFANVTTANSLYSTDGSTEKTISGSYQGYRFPRYNNQNITSRADTITTNNNNVYSYGNYYTWAAAIADTTHYSTNNQSATGTSICPSGWHLPIGGNKSNESNNEFWAYIVTGLNNGTNPANYDSNTQPYYTGTPEGSDVSNKLRSYPNNFLYSGDVYSGSVGLRGSFGSYWSSTAYSSYYAYYLYLYSTSVYPGTYYYYKYNGRSIRCLSSS